MTNFECFNDVDFMPDRGFVQLTPLPQRKLFITLLFDEGKSNLTAHLQSQVLTSNSASLLSRTMAADTLYTEFAWPKTAHPLPAVRALQRGAEFVGSALLLNMLGCVSRADGSTAPSVKEKDDSFLDDERSSTWVTLSKGDLR